MQIATRPTVAAVVAAHDEEERLGHVLDVLTSYPDFAEVVVVDDGSSDATAEVARRGGATCLRLPVNRGKGAALQAGIAHAGTDVLFLADADIRGLDHVSIDAMLAPVLAGEVDMFVAMRHRSIYRLRTVLRFLPLLGGERAVTAKLWHSLPDHYRHRFKIEAALNFHAVHRGRGLRYRVLPIRHTLKERKYGLVRGSARRLRMSADVAAAIAEVHLREAPDDVRARRRTATAAIVGVVAVGSGARLTSSVTRRHRTAGRLLLGLGAVTTTLELTRLAQSPARCRG